MEEKNEREIVSKKLKAIFFIEAASCENFVEK